MNLRAINFRQPRYLMPLIALPFLLFLGYQGTMLMASSPKEREVQKTLDLSFGESSNQILSKQDAYEKEALGSHEEKALARSGRESEEELNSQTSERERALLAQRKALEGINFQPQKREGEGYSTSKSGSKTRDWFRAFNERTLGGAPTAAAPTKEELGPLAQSSSTNSEWVATKREPATVSAVSAVSAGSAQGAPSPTTAFAPYGDTLPEAPVEKPMDPVRILREQMLMLDSLEKAKDPEFLQQQKASEKLKENKKKLDTFLKSTLSVSRHGRSSSFNSIHRETEPPFLKATLDEMSTGYLGSRIRIRLLEDIWVGEKKLLSGQSLYAQISGFSSGRVNLSVVSVFAGGEILPVHLEIYDLDGLKGLYVPSSQFREMMKEIGATSMGTGIGDSYDSGFYSSLFSSVFRSASSTASRIVRTNKAKLKEGTQLYLVEGRIY